MIKFGTDGVRGQANSELTPEIAFKLGRFGGYVLAQHIEEDRPRVLSLVATRVSAVVCWNMHLFQVCYLLVQKCYVWA